MKRTPQAKIIRRGLELTQEEFAVRYHIPPGTPRRNPTTMAHISRSTTPQAGWFMRSVYWTVPRLAGAFCPLPERKHAQACL